MKCTRCHREIPQGEPYAAITSSVEVDDNSGSPLILDSVTVIAHCVNKGCLLYASVQMHPCLEKYHAQ